MDTDERARSADEIRGWLEGMRGRDLSDAEVEEAARRLQGEREVALPILLDQFYEEDATLLALAMQALKGWAPPHPVKPLLQRLQDPGVDDLAKGMILIILDRYGLDVDRPEISGVGINLDAYPRNPTGGGNGGTGGA